MLLFEIIIWGCCFYLLFPLFTSFLSIFLPDRVKAGDTVPDSCDFACVITVYKELDIAWPLVRSLLKQGYPNFHIYLVADGVTGNIEGIEDAGLTIIRPDKALNGKVASLNLAFEQMQDKHTHVVVFDPDNLVPESFLDVMNKYHHSGFKAVQAKRIAKNINGTYAALDALGEYYYDFSVRYVPYILGSSSTIAGSGMSIEKNIYWKNVKKECETLREKGVVVAEDKSLQLDLALAGIRIAYAAAAVIFDEKITSSAQIGKQRGRWLNSYFGHSFKALKALITGLFRLDWNLFYFALTILMPPMVVLVGLSLVLVVWAALFNLTFLLLLIGCLLIFALGFVAILTFNHTPPPVIAVIPSIPLFVLGQLSGFLNIRKANKDFMATTHEEEMEIEDVWKERRDEFDHFSLWWPDRGGRTNSGQV